QAPIGDLRLTVRGLATGGMQPMDLRTELHATGKDVRTVLDLRQNNNAIAHLTASIGAPAGQLRSPKVLATAPLSVEGTFQPTRISDLQAISAPDEETA